MPPAPPCNKMDHTFSSPRSTRAASSPRQRLPSARHRLPCGHRCSLRQVPRLPVRLRPPRPDWTSPPRAPPGAQHRASPWRSHRSSVAAREAARPSPEATRSSHFPGRAFPGVGLPGVRLASRRSFSHHTNPVCAGKKTTLEYDMWVPHVILYRGWI